MSTGVPIQPRDSLGHFMIPQSPEEAGYYVYGNVGGIPGTGHLAQYADPDLLTVIFWVEHQWQAIDTRKFGIGNISVANGRRSDHNTHMKGIEVDIRPVRKDRLVGQAARCSRFDEKIYDRAATIKLVQLFLRHPMVRIIYFNDEKVQQACGRGRVKYCPQHDDHLHIAIWERR